LRVAGTNAGAAGAVGATAAVVSGARDVAAGAVVCGTVWREIGRGFGKGTVAQASTLSADRPTVSTRPVAMAVDRKAAARAERVTAVLCGGESSDRSGEQFLFD